MNVLILGSGGREHAIAWKLAQSSNLQKLFIAPGNAGTSQYGQNVPISINPTAPSLCMAPGVTIMNTSNQ